MKNCKVRLLECAAVLAITSATTAIGASSAFAQTEPTANDDVVVVTGSRIARTNAQSAVPVQMIGAMEFEESGTSDLSEVLSEIPGVAYGVSQRGSNNNIQVAGLTTVSLRRLGDSRTLTLVNGKRAVSNSGNGDRVSLSTIPGGLVKRTEVTTGGASAIYGSDAIAGVVNFILEDSFEGFEADATYRTPEASGGEEFDFEVTYGTKFANDRGYILLSGEYQDENAIFADSTRPLSVLPVEWDDPSLSSRDDFADEANTPGCDITNPDGSINGDRYCLLPSYSSSPPGGTFDGDAWVTREGVFVNDRGVLTDRAVGRDFFGDFDGFDFRPGRTIEGSREIMNLGLRSTYEFAPNATGSLTVSYSDIQSETKGSAQSISSGSDFGPNNEFEVDDIPGDNPFIPQIVEDTRSGDLSFTRRLTELGQNARINDRRTLRMVTDMKGTLDNGFDYEVFATYGHFTQIQDNPNEANLLHIKNALNVESDGAGGFQCVDADARANGCVPLNLFGLNTITAEMADYIRYDAHSEQRRSQITFGGQMTGDLIEINAGPVKFAAGLEFRRENQNTIGDPDDPANLGGQDGDPSTPDINVSTFSSFPSISANYEVWEGFGELDIPIVEDLFNVQLAGRVADYSSVGTIFSYNAGGVFTPIDGLKIRGQYSRSQRAPTITELFSAPRTDADTVAGPCNDLLPTAGADGFFNLDPLEGTGGLEAGTSILATVAANCLAEPGIQAYFADPDQSLNPDGTIEPFDDDGSIRGPNAGNRNLNVETANTFTIGAVVQPSFIPNLTFIADYYRIEISDVITSLSSQDQLDQCYSSTDFPNNRFCADISRSQSTGQVTQIINRVDNLDELLVEGIDASLRYRFEAPSIPGEWDVDLRYSHYFTDQVIFTGINDIQFTETTLGEIETPENEFRARLAYELGNARLSYTLSFEEGGVDDINNHPNPGDNQYYAVDSQYYHSIYGRYDFGDDDNYRLYGGVRNIANNLGPLIPSGTKNGSSLNIVSDLNRPVGREFYVGARVRF